MRRVGSTAHALFDVKRGTQDLEQSSEVMATGTDTTSNTATI